MRDKSKRSNPKPQPNAPTVDAPNAPDAAVGLDNPPAVDAPADTSNPPADVPASNDAPAVAPCVTAFRTAFPNAPAVPTWLEPMVAAIVAIHAAVPADKRGDYDAVLSAASAIVTRPADGSHAFTLGSGRDIARTQNAVYVAFAVSGLVKSDVPNAFGAAMWRAIIGPTKCDYRAHAGYFASTMTDTINGRHNSTPGIGATETAIGAVINTWANPPKS